MGTDEEHRLIERVLYEEGVQINNSEPHTAERVEVLLDAARALFTIAIRVAMSIAKKAEAKRATAFPCAGWHVDLHDSGEANGDWYVRITAGKDKNLIATSKANGQAIVAALGAAGATTSVSKSVSS